MRGEAQPCVAAGRVSNMYDLECCFSQNWVDVVHVDAYLVILTFTDVAGELRVERCDYTHTTIKGDLESTEAA